MQVNCKKRILRNLTSLKFWIFVTAVMLLVTHFIGATEFVMTTGLVLGERLGSKYMSKRNDH
jgi:hypothetical protein